MYHMKGYNYFLFWKANAQLQYKGKLSISIIPLFQKDIINKHQAIELETENKSLIDQNL